MTQKAARWAKVVRFLSASRSGSPRPGPQQRRRLLLEPLEDRCVPTTITPTTFADGVLGSGSLRDAVLQFNTDAGTDDDTIQLDAGTYSLTIQNVGGRHETAGQTGDLNLTQTSHHWIIQGTGPSTIIDASQLRDRVFQIVNPGTQVVFRDLVIQGGLAQDNGADGALAGTTDALGGGILNNGGTVTLDNVAVQNNVARGGDAAILRAPGHNASGGAFYSTGGALTLAGATIANNQVTGGRGGNAPESPGPAGPGGSGNGGGLSATGGSLDIANSTIGSNGATGGRGGDGFVIGFSGGSSRFGGLGGSVLGGGLYVSGGSLTIASSTIASNQAPGGPGGAYGDGGWVEGGGLYVSGGSLTIASSTIASNQGVGGSTDRSYPDGLEQGAGLYNAGMLTLRNSAFAGNSATGSGYGEGGAIFNYGTLTVTNSALSGNSDAYGGGIYNGYYGTLTVSNSTLSGNTATYYGGGISTSWYSTHPVTLTNVTLTANRAYTGGGGFFASSGSPVLHNTLIAGNFRGATGTTRDDVYGALNGDYNLIGDGTGMGGLSNGVNGNLVGSAAAPIDPLLGPLQDNGGPTFTHALLPGSPAIDAGNNAYATEWDQRGEGFPRIVNGIIDIGAFEYQGAGSAPLFTRSLRGNEPAAGTPFDVIVQPVDVFGEVAFGYRGTVTFSVTDPDPAVVLPADYTFTADDQGTHTFTGQFTLITSGMWTLTTADLAYGLSQDVMPTVDT
jgi:hypothetical protein